MACKALSSDEEIATLVLWEPLEPIDKEELNEGRVKWDGGNRFFKIPNVTTTRTLTREYYYMVSVGASQR